MVIKSLSSDEIIQRLDDLPAIPSVVHELSELISNPMSSTAEIEKLMASDQSLTTKVLKLVNSSYYAIPGGVSNVGRAIAYLGYDTVHQLVLSSSILQALRIEGASSEFNISEFWKHSLGVAIAAETIGKFIRHPLPSDLFTCGLVHDMGKMALYTLAPNIMLKVSQLALKEGLSYAEAEVLLEASRHTTVGYRLGQKWRLPSQILAVIKNHHQKDHQVRGSLSSDLNRYVDIVYLSNLLIHALKFGHSGHQKILGAPVDIMERLSIHPQNDFKILLRDIKAALSRADDFLRLLGDPL